MATAAPSMRTSPSRAIRASLACVLEHIATTHPSAAVIVTDGYVEAISREQVSALAATTRIHAIVTRDGNPSLLRSAGIAYSQLGKVPS